MIIQTIDSGKHGGWAVFQDRALTQCGLADPTKGEGPPAVGADIVWVEVPQWQPGDGGDPNRSNRWIHDAFYRGLAGAQPNDHPLASRRVWDLCKTAYRGGLLARACCCSDVRVVHPHEWKAGVPKRIHNRRISEKMTPGEALRFCNCDVSRKQAHNVLDAIGIGLWAVGR